MKVPDYIMDGLPSNREFYDLMTAKEQVQFVQAFEYERITHVERDKFFMTNHDDFLDFVISAFKWDDSAQGYDYWQQIVDSNQ